MKRLGIFAILVVCFLLSLASCGAPTPQPSVPSSSQTPTPDATPAIEPTPTPALTPLPPTGELKVYFIDVGQGDSILIDLGETEILIDGGVHST